jgi:hypothetical protein
MTALASRTTLVLNGEWKMRKVKFVENMKLVCVGCHNEKTILEFKSIKRRGRVDYFNVCLDCYHDKMNAYYRDNKHIWLESKERLGKEHQAEITRRHRQKLKSEVVDNYGGKCACCGEDRIDFLTIEHTMHDGKKHREETNGKTYGDLKKRGFPKDLGIVIFCWNCNMATRFGGICPHKSESGVK